MPSLVLYGGYRTFVGGDDLRVFTMCALALRVVQIVVLSFLSYHASKYFDKLRNFSVEKHLEQCLEDKDDVDYPRLMDHSFEFFLAYVISSWVMVLTGVAIELSIWRTGARGSPVQQEKRACLRPLCFLKMLPMSLFRVVNIAFGSVGWRLLQEVCTCDGTAEDPRKLCPDYYQWRRWVACLIVTQLIEAIVAGSFFMYFFCASTPRMPSCLSAETKWQWCCKCCCTAASILTCFLNGGNDNSAGDFADVAILLSDFFDGKELVDVVLSDVIVGLRMLARIQRLRRREAQEKLVDLIDEERDNVDADENGLDHGVEADDDDHRIAKFLLKLQERKELDASDAAAPSTFSQRAGMRRRQSVVFNPNYSNNRLCFEPELRLVLSRSNAKDRIAIAEGIRFIRLSAAIYEFTLCATQDGLLWMCRKAKSAVSDIGDRIGHGFQLKEQVQDKFRKIAGVEKDVEFVYVQFVQGLAQTPYCIVIDRPWRSIAISIRGTQGLDDIVADMTMRPESMEEWGKKCNFDGKDFYAHAGMLACTEWIYKDIESHGLLEKLLQRPDLVGFRVRLCGHSLGAGCASLLSFLLRSRYPTLRCHCFCPPGCTMSENMAESCKSYLTSYVLDDDIVPRFSWDALDNLRYSVLELIARIKVTKHQASRANDSVKETVLLHGKDSIPESKFLVDLMEFRRVQMETRHKLPTRIPLCPPGNIVHLIKTRDDEKVGGCCIASSSKDDFAEPEEMPGTKGNYAARWAHRSDLAEIMISSHFVDDHSTVNVMAELEKAAIKFGLLAPDFVIDDHDGEV